MLACCIYGHFLSSLNRAGCAGNLRSPLQMVCIMFKPPCHHPPPPPALSFSLSLPFSINHQNLKLYVFEKKRHPFAFSLQKGIRKSYKIFRGPLSTSNTPTPLPFPPPPHASFHPSAGLSSPLCPGHGALISGWVDFPPLNRRGSSKTPHKGSWWLQKAGWISTDSLC